MCTKIVASLSDVALYRHALSDAALMKARLYGKCPSSTSIFWRYNRLLFQCKNNHFCIHYQRLSLSLISPANTTTYWDHMGTVIVVVVINIFLAVVRPALLVLDLAFFFFFFFLFFQTSHFIYSTEDVQLSTELTSLGTANPNYHTTKRQSAGATK